MDSMKERTWGEEARTTLWRRWGMVALRMAYETEAIDTAVAYEGRGAEASS
jgi:hypothetical protein